MDSDYAVELGQNDPALEMPWSDPEGRLQYQNLRRNPETLLLIDEANSYRELGEFLSVVNSRQSIVESAKCDVWTDHELSEAEEIYEASVKFSSYVDLLFCENERRFDFEFHEAFAARLVELLGRAPEVSATAEIIIRRCYYKSEGDVDDGESRAGFYFTLYASGYGDDAEEARKRWGVGMMLVQNALVQISAEFRAEASSSRI